MNRKEHLLTILAEEGSEVAQACSKALRFGIKDQLTLDPTGPVGTTGPTNQERIRDEFIDLVAVYEMGVKEGILIDADITINDEFYDAAEKKKEKVESFLLYSDKKGTLTKHKSSFEVEELISMLTDIRINILNSRSKTSWFRFITHAKLNFHEKTLIRMIGKANSHLNKLK